MNLLINLKRGIEGYGLDEVIFSLEWEVCGVLEMLTQEMFSLRQVWKSEFKLEISCKKAFHPRGNARDKKKHQGYGGTGKVSSLGGVWICQECQGKSSQT